MELRHLDHFLAVVEHGGITRAAAALYLSQPALSQSIRQLERDVGAELFDRTARPLALTAAGAAVAESARRIRAGVTAAVDAVTAVNSLTAGRLDIATLPRFELAPLPEIASRFRRLHPSVILNISAPRTAVEVVSQVRRGVAELAIVDSTVDAGALDVAHLTNQEMCLVVPAAWAETLPDPVPHTALRTLPLVLAEPLSDIVAGVDAAVAVDCEYWPAVVDLVRLGAGATLLPRRPRRRSTPELVERSLDPPIERAVCIAVRPGALSAAAAAFIELARADHTSARVASTRNARPAADSDASS